MGDNGKENGNYYSGFRDLGLTGLEFRGGFKRLRI